MRFFFLFVVSCFASSVTFLSAASGQEQQPTGLQLAAAMEKALVSAIERTEKSVVAIARVSAARQAQVQVGSDFIPNEYGTGVIIDRKGLILTQYHVIKNGDTHWVTTAERKTYRATIKGADPRSGLAVLEVAAEDLPEISLGDASQLRKGQLCIALGNPYSIARDGQASASWGIISNIARKAGPTPSSDRAKQRATIHHFGTLIQTDAKLNLGTSGGALINLKGEMIGLTTSLAVTAGYETSAGYAVPVDAMFRRVVETLKQGREVEYGLLGVRPENLSPQETLRGVHGARIDTVMPGTPAGMAGLLPRDIITHVNGKPVHDADGLVREVGRLPASAAARLTVNRRGRPVVLTAKLAKYPVEGQKIVTQKAEPWRGIRVDYSTVISSSQRPSLQGDIDVNGCVLVTEVAEDSPAWKQGIRPQMFISHVEGKRISRPADFYDAVKGQEGSVQIRLTLSDDSRPLRRIPPGN